MVNLTLEENKLHVTPAPAEAPTVSLRLDSLRIVFLFVPETCDWRFVEATAGRNLVNLEELADEDLAELTGQASALGAEAGGFSLLLEDYTGRSASISLADVRASGVDLLGELSRHREVRRGKLAEWMRAGPGLIVTGALGDRVTLDPKGVQAIGGERMPWEELDRIECEPNPAEDLHGYRFIPRPDSASSEFSMRIPDRKAELFTAEYTFWRSVSRRQG